MRQLTEHEGLICAVAQLFTHLLKRNLEAPQAWKVSKLRLIFKMGNVILPSNYRPISILPVMAKLFSTVIYARLQPIIDENLLEEQFGFRRQRGCADAIHVLRFVVEKSSEWGEELWIAALDVEKAFDRVHHSVLFSSLLQTKLDMSTVAALRNL